jgi:AcrR family transcriptional regulator
LLSDGERPPLGLRERKKPRLLPSPRGPPLRLFKEQGYEATTVSQIAEAVEISESTFFRYFPTKEAVVMWDGLDPLVEAAFLNQPPELGPIAALRAATHEIFSSLPEADLAEQRERWALVMSESQLRGAVLEQFTGSIDQIAALVAARTGRRPDDFAVIALSGAMVGVALAVLTATEDPFEDFVALLDRALAQLEAGLPL